MTRTAAVMFALLALALPLAACGGGKDKPAYCGQKDTLQSDIKGLPDDLKSGGVSAVQTSLTKIQGDVTTLVSSAKSDFPSETQALSSAVDGLKTAVSAMGSSPSTTELLALLPAAQAAVQSVQNFVKAADSKC